MAIQKCHECGKDVSTTAKACPNCGASVKKPLLQRNIGCLGGIVIISLLYAVSGIFTGGGSNPSPPSPPAIQQPEDPALIKKRVELQRKNVELQNKKEADFLKSKAGIIWAKHKDWDREDCKTIAERKIYIGMNAEQVRLAWGKPYKINISTGVWGEHEQWVMHEEGSTYLYFQNGKLTSIQRSK